MTITFNNNRASRPKSHIPHIIIFQWTVCDDFPVRARGSTTRRSLFGERETCNALTLFEHSKLLTSLGRKTEIRRNWRALFQRAVTRIEVSDRMSSSRLPPRTLPMTSEPHASSKTDTEQSTFLTFRKGFTCHCEQYDS
jgi:hypothetical protein